MPAASLGSLVAAGAHVLLYLDLHQRLGQNPEALPEEVHVVLHMCLAQQLLQSYPQLIGHRVLHWVDWSLPKEPHGGRLRQQPQLLHTHADTTENGEETEAPLGSF
jgi:hypothetical protein